MPHRFYLTLADHKTSILKIQVKNRGQVGVIAYKSTQLFQKFLKYEASIFRLSEYDRTIQIEISRFCSNRLRNKRMIFKPFIYN